MTRDQVKLTQVNGTQEKVSSLMERKNMNKTQIEKTIDLVKSLKSSVAIIESGRRETRYVFSDKELKALESVSLKDLETLLGEEKAQILWERLVQNNIRRWTGKTISLADVKEFSYYGEDLSSDVGARQILMARNLGKLNEISR